MSKKDTTIIKLRLALIFFIVLLFPIASVLAAETGNLYPLFYGKTVKIHVAEVKDSTKDHETDRKIIKEKLEEALAKRKNIHFQITQDPSEAEIIVNTEVQEFMWTDHDPVDMLIGVVGTVKDIVTVEDYARLQADISMTDTKTHKELWKQRLMATVTKKPMSRKESIPLVTEKFVKVFVRDCFSKRSSGQF